MTGVWHVRMGAGAAWRKTVWGEFLSEYLGVFVLIAFGDGVVAMAVAALNQSGRAATDHTIFLASGDWLLITWGWCVAVVMGIYVAGGISGAHLNPAVTISLAVRRGFPWAKVPTYITAQVAGAFTGAALVYLNYKDAIKSYERGAALKAHCEKKLAEASARIEKIALGADGSVRAEPAKFD